MIEGSPWSLHDLQHDGVRVESQLRVAGLGDGDGIAGKVALFSEASASLDRLDPSFACGGEEEAGDKACAAFWVPGRVELAGKHTDYAGCYSGP